jgi:hypothetical protein
MPETLYAQILEKKSLILWISYLMMGIVGSYLYLGLKKSRLIMRGKIK